MTITLYISGAISPLMTQLAGQIGIDVGDGATQITSLNVATGWYDWLVYYVFYSLFKLF